MPTTRTRRQLPGTAACSRCVARALLIGLLWLLQQGSSLYAQSNCGCPTFGNTYTVTNNSPFYTDGSLSCAIFCVNFTGNLNRIVFNIPTPGVNTITLDDNSGPLSWIQKNGVIIDGTAIESVIINGSQLTGQNFNGVDGLFVFANNVTIRGIRVTGFTNSYDRGGNGIRIIGNNALIENNVLTGNHRGIRIDENYNVGSPPVSPGGEGNQEPSASLTVDGVRIFNNRIGVTLANAAAPNVSDGILVVQAPATLDIRGNIIANNSAGIRCQVAGGTVLISDNSTYCNAAGGIVRSGGPAAPTITQATTQVISGTAAPFTDIEVFTHNTLGCPSAPCQGRALIGVVSSDINGNWFITPAVGTIVAGNQVTATTTVSNLNTSPFSPCRTVVGCTISASINATQITCNGSNDGQLTAVPAGNVGATTYLWSNGATSATISGLAPGTYTVTITDSQTCADTASATLLNPPPLSLSLTGTNLLCFGNNGGSVSSAVMGGVSPYTYAWSNGASTPSINALPAGTYSLTLTDAYLCTRIASVTLSQPPQLSLSFNVTDESAFMANNGVVNAIVTGGTGSYAYSWGTGQTTPSISGLAPGTYVLTVTDGNGCGLSDNANVAAFVCPPFSLDTSSTNISCNGFDDGTISLAPLGGNSPIAYSWNTGATTSDLSNLGPGFYTVTATDGTNCTALASFSIAEPPALSLSLTATDETAFMAADGTATASASGGTGMLQYIWNTGATTPNITALLPGTYSVTGTDENACALEGSVEVLPYICPSFSVSIAGTNLLCFEDNSGAAEAIVMGGSSPYTFLWGDGGNGAIRPGLSAGLYEVSVTDAFNCPASASITITEPPLLVLAASATDETAFAANDGTASTVVMGGTGSYTYAWSNGASSSDLSGLAPGTYSVTVSDENACEVTASVTVALYVCPEIFLFVEAQNVACNGDMSGSATAFVSGGTEPYTYLWSNGSLESSISNLGPGIYALSLTDARNCSIIESINISQPFPLLINVFSDDESAFAASDGSAGAIAGGGTGDLSFAWSNGDTGEEIFGLAPGTYSVTVTDENGCAATGSTVIFPYECDGFSVNIAVQNVACHGDETGSLTATVTGAVGILTYAWSTGATSATLSGLPVGAYGLTVTDGANCTESRMATVLQPTQPLSVFASSTDETAFGAADGTASATATGGTPGYGYFWSTGANSPTITELPPGTYSVTAVDANACEATATVVVNPALCSGFDIAVSATPASCNGFNDGTATVSVPGSTYAILWSTGAGTPSIGGLAAGSYGVTVTDLSTGCVEMEAATVSQPTAITVSPTATNETAFMANNGTATANPSGGNTDEYTYAWSNGSTTQTVLNLAPGTYAVTVTELTGCTGVDSVEIQPFVCPLLELSTTGTDVVCHGDSTGAASVAVLSGSDQYGYQWSNGSTTETASGLAAGTYTVTVTDILNNCSDTASISIGQPTLLLASAAATPQMAFMAADGTATVVPMGGTPTYLYAWSNGGNTPTITSLLPGLYAVTVSDANGCTAIVSAEVVPYVCPGFELSLTRGNVACHGDSTGSASASALGGDTSFAYAWSTGQTTPNISALPAGTYIVTVTDLADNCAQIDSIAITQPDVLMANATATPETDVDANDGTATANPTGGTPSYNYDWGNLGNTQTISELVPSLYFVTVTDANGCMAIDSTVVDSVICAGIELEVQGQDAPCHGEATGAATASSSNPEVQYLWSNGSTVPSLTGLAAGTYTVTATDADGCTEEAAIDIGEPEPLLAAASATAETAFLAADGTAMSSPSGGTPMYSYLWSEGSTVTAISGLSPGTYVVTVTDLNGCEAMSSAVVAAYICPGLTLAVQGQDASCYGEATGEATVAATGGSGQYAYAWSSGAVSQTATGLIAGIYTVTVTDIIDNCPAVASVEIGEPDSLVLELTATAETAFMAADGTASVVPSGGTPPYGYQWSNGAITATISALLPGAYGVTVTDANDCEATGSIVVEPFICPGFVLAVETVAVGCAGEATGQASVSVLNPTSTYQYAWSNGSTLPSIGELIAGTYTVTVTDVANNCPDTASVTIAQPAPLVVVTTVTPETAFMAANGTATAMPSGGTSAYEYQWSNGATTPSITSLSPGAYTVIVTDANGCTAEQAVVVETFICPGFQVSIAAQDVGCNGENTGTATASVANSNGSFSFAWSTGAATAAITGLDTGVYTVTVTDVANNCPEEASATINEPAPLSLNLLVSQETGFEAADGTVSAQVSGGVLAYNFLWSNGQTTATITDLPPGEYGVTVTDMNGCTVEGQAAVTAFPCPSYTVAIEQSHVTCQGFEDGTATAIPVGGSPDYTYLWSTGATTATISGLPPGTYSVMVRDVDNCPAEQTTSISEPPLLTVAVTTSAETATGANNGTASAAVAGGVPPYNYAWSNGATGPNALGLAPGTYQLIVTDLNGCTALAEAVIDSVPPPPCDIKPVFFLSAPDVVCLGDEFELEAEDLFPSDAVRYIWYLPNGDSLISDRPFITVLASTAEFSGGYAVRRDSLGCLSDTVRSAGLVQVLSLSAELADAGANITLCSEVLTKLDATPPTAGAGTWQLLQGAAVFDDATDPKTMVRDLAAGRNLLRWQVSLAVCETVFADTLEVFVERPPLAVGDEHQLLRAQDVLLMEVLLNDDLSGLQDTAVVLMDMPARGSLSFDPVSRRFTYTEEEGFRGIVSFQYQVCNPATVCSYPCDTAVVNIDVLNLPRVPEAIIIDGSDRNRRLIIPGIDGFDRIEIAVFNRWGDLVFQAKQYDNNKPWEGDLNGNGRYVPEGVYFYYLKAFENEVLIGEVLTGTIHVLEER